MKPLGKIERCKKCGRSYWKGPPGSRVTKPYRTLPIRRRDCVTCSPDCARDKPEKNIDRQVDMHKSIYA